VANKTKIIATIGPSSRGKAVLRKLILAGMNVARLNFSYGTQEEHGGVISTIRSLSKEMKIPVGILLDLQGPKIRTGALKGGKPIPLKRNSTINITSRNVAGTPETISTSYRRLTRDVDKGDRILLDDGLIELRVLSKNRDTVTCKIITGGLLKEHKGINLPGVRVSAPSLTQKDRKDLLFGIKAGADYFALSFVRSADDLRHIKAVIKKQGSDIPVIAKIERPDAVKNLGDILKVSDGIMVARGDLGVEMRPEQVPAIQKDIIHRTIQANKPVITATQMLETMTGNPIPTRAEASDVANAIYDGTDAVMLSAETASGRYPVKAVQMMAKIASEVEKSPFMRYNLQYERDRGPLVPMAVAESSVNIIHETGAKAIIVFSVSGKTSKLISRQRPSRPIYSFAPSRRIYDRLSLVWGITPLLIPAINDTRRLIEAGERIVVKKRFARKNDLVIIVTGLALKSGSTNVIKIHRIGKED